MKTLSELIKNREVKKLESERGEMLRFFRGRLTDKKGKPYRYPFLGMKLAHLSIHDLYYLRSTCLDAESRGGSFSKCFWGSIKVKTTAQPSPENGG